MPHTISECNLETYSPRDHRLQSTPVANSSSDCITSTLWFILGFFSHSDTLLDFAQLGSQSSSWWHYQFCSMVYSRRSLGSTRTGVWGGQGNACWGFQRNKSDPAPLSYLLPPSQQNKTLKVVKLNQRRGVKHSRSSESCLGPACSQSSHREQPGYCTLLHRALLFIF